MLRRDASPPSRGAYSDARTVERRPPEGCCAVLLPLHEVEGVGGGKCGGSASEQGYAAFESWLERDLAHGDVVLVEDAQPELARGADVQRFALRLGQRGQAVLLAQLLDHAPADDVHRHGIRRRIDRL